MASEVFVLGLSWQKTPVSVREKISFTDDELREKLTELCQMTIAELMVISTCNRVEIYGVTTNTSESLVNATSFLRQHLSEMKHISIEELSQYLYEKHGRDAVEHIFSVSSALDSLVLGETQILGQIKSAYGLANNETTIGPLLGRCMEHSFKTAKRVRTETDVSRGAANISSVAVELANKVFGSLAGRNVLIVGAGKMSALAARHLRASGCGVITVLNRSEGKAVALANEVDGIAKPWSELEDQLLSSDVVICSTGSKEPILKVKSLKRAMKKRRHKPLTLIDIAVPRDVEAKAADLDGVYLFDVDDLQNVVAENIKERHRSSKDALLIVKEETQSYIDWLGEKKVVPTIRALRNYFHQVAKNEAILAQKKLVSAQGTEEQNAIVDNLTERLVNKLLHPAMKALKDQKKENVEELIQAADKLFDLENKSESIDTETKDIEAQNIEGNPMVIHTLRKKST